MTSWKSFNDNESDGLPIIIYMLSNYDKLSSFKRNALQIESL